jgi:hypothetical protein
MTRSLDILIMESQRGAASVAEEALRAAGHRLHRCHQADDRGFPCVGVVRPDDCPMDQRIDVALLVRPHVQPRPTPLEDGVSCVLRAGVPLVEDGPDLLDPYDPWVAERIATELDVVAACNRAAERALDPLRADILDRIAILTKTVGVRADRVECRIVPDGVGLRVELCLPRPIDPQVEQALAVRVLDAVRASGKTYGEVNVKVVVADSPASAR